MKIRNPHEVAADRRRRRAEESGFAVLVVMALLSIMLILVASSVQGLTDLQRDLRRLNERQQARFAASPPWTSPGTNAVSAVRPPRP